MKRVLKSVSVADIRIDGGTQVRVSVSPEWIQEMVDNMKNDVEYPPVEARYDGTHYWLSDGFHRYHAHSRMGLKNIDVMYLPGTMHEAQLDALGSNDKHGLYLSKEDKIKKVQIALGNPLVKDKSNYAIAKLCKFSQPFVASVRDPKTKEKQEESKKRHVVKKAKEIEKQPESVTNQISNQKESEIPVGGEGPDEAELLANEAQHAADLETLAKFLDADDKMKHLYEEVQRLTNLNVGFELRIKELMNEKRSAVKLAEKLQKELDKIKGKK